MNADDIFLKIFEYTTINGKHKTVKHVCSSDRYYVLNCFDEENGEAIIII